MDLSLSWHVPCTAYGATSVTAHFQKWHILLCTSIKFSFVNMMLTGDVSLYLSLLSCLHVAVSHLNSVAQVLTNATGSFCERGWMNMEICYQPTIKFWEGVPDRCWQQGRFGEVVYVR